MSTQATMKISLPQDLKDMTVKLAQMEQYSSTSGFVAQLIRQEVQRYAEVEHLNKALRKGLASPPAKQLPQKFFKQLRNSLS